MSKIGTVLLTVAGRVIGFFVGGFVVLFLFVAVVSGVAGPLSSADMTTWEQRLGQP